MPRRRQLTGAVVAVCTTAALIAVMLPFRSGLDIAIVALVLVVPVVVGAATGGFVSGLVAVTVGFFGYDLYFLPPYGTLTVSSTDGWDALAVYAVVMVLVSRVVGRLWREERASRESRERVTQLFELAELLVSDRLPNELFGIVVNSVRDAFGAAAVVLMLPRTSDGSRPSAAGLEVVSSAGRPLGGDELAHLMPAAGVAASLRTYQPTPPGNGAVEALERVVLHVGDRVVGLLGIVGPPLSPERRQLLDGFANHIALAIERSRLRDQHVRLQLLEQIDRHRQYLFGAVSHDLRTPLASVKAAASALRERAMTLSEPDREELLALIETQADRLSRVVSNLLDMSRIQAGALVMDRKPVSLDELFASVLEAVGQRASRLKVSLGSQPVVVVVDRALLVEALVNVVENALRYAPESSTVELAGSLDPADSRPVRVAVTDRGPGIPQSLRAQLFNDYPSSTAERALPERGAGLGLAIAQAFVEAHGGTIEIQDVEPGTRVVVSLPTSALPAEPSGDALSRAG